MCFFYSTDSNCFEALNPNQLNKFINKFKGSFQYVDKKQDPRHCAVLVGL